MNIRHAALPVIVLALAACSGPPPQMTVNGTVTVGDNPGMDIYPPVQDGSQVTVTDPSGKVIAVTGLDGNAPQGATFTLTYGFTVKVPEGESFYGIAVSGLSGTEQFSQGQMQRGPAICSGGAC